MSKASGLDFYLPFTIPATELAAPTVIELIAPCDGIIEEAQVIVQTAIVTGGDVTFAVGVTTVAGLTVTVANSATKGTVVTDTPTDPSDTRRFLKGDRIQVIPGAAFNGGGALAGQLLCNTSYSRA